jgi:hypothetical protein
LDPARKFKVQEPSQDDIRQISRLLDDFIYREISRFWQLPDQRRRGDGLYHRVEALEFLEDIVR